MAVEKASISIAVEIVGVILNKVRDCASNKLKDGDLTNEELRQVLVRDLKEINTKLDSLALKDLDASRRFLKEGMSFLILALDKPSKDQETRDGPDGATATDNACGDLNVVLTLPQAIQKLQISSEKRLEEAKKSFHDARKDATHAFSNKSLSIKDRVMACKIRVAARIFESGLEDPDAAISACLLALEELHSLPAIQDMFKVFLYGGMRSWRNKAERLENIMSVLFINHALFDFAAKCSSKYPNVFTWPRIELADRTFHPILHAYDIVEKTSMNNEEFGQQLNRTVVNTRISGHCGYFAVNSRGEIILLDDDGITVIYRSGESKDVRLFDIYSLFTYRIAVAVDSDDNVYVVRFFINDCEVKFVLCVLDENYNIKHYSILLDFLETHRLGVAVDKNKNIIMVTEEALVYICDNAGKLKFKFEREIDKEILRERTRKFKSSGTLFGRRIEPFFCPITNIAITDKNDIVLESPDRGVVHVYTTEGNLRSTIKLPNLYGMAFHHGISKMIVRSWDDTLLCYSETGELGHSVRGIFPAAISSHPSGAFAVLQGASITLI